AGTVGQNLAASLGGGALDKVIIDGASVRGGASVNGAYPTVTLQNNARVGAALTVQGSAAAGTVKVNINDSVVSGAATIGAFGGNDSILLNNSTVLGVLSADIGGGLTNTITLTN